MIKLVKQFAKCESGATAIEYALMAGIIGVGVVTAAQTLTGNIKASFDSIGSALTAAVPPQ
jgi:pilus assembly protein Flp/PilA